MTLLTKPVFEKLIEHILNIEESIDALADFYFPDSSEDREDLKQFFRYYIKKVETAMEQVKSVSIFEKVPNPEELNNFPFVIIGSEVELKSTTGSNSYVFRLVEPVGNNMVKNGVSYLSDFGRELLLKKAGSVINFSRQGSQESLRITKIRL